MILGFEEYTIELNEEETKIAKKIAAKIELSVGKENAVTNDRIQYYFGMNDIKIGGARVRKMIQYIRQKGLVKDLCATSNGYFVAANRKELDDYITSLKQRRNSIDFTLYCIENQSELCSTT